MAKKKKRNHRLSYSSSIYVHIYHLKNKSLCCIDSFPPNRWAFHLSLNMYLLSKTYFFFLLHFPACGILVPWPGIKPRLSEVEAWSPNHRAAREFPPKLFNVCIIFNRVEHNHLNLRNLKVVTYLFTWIYPFLLCVCAGEMFRDPYWCSFPIFPQSSVVVKSLEWHAHVHHVTSVTGCIKSLGTQCQVSYLQGAGGPKWKNQDVRSPMQGH